MTDEIISYTLKKPIEHGDKTFSRLTFREATVGDIMLAESVAGGNVARSAVMLANIADVPLPAFKKIPAREFNKILDLTKDLLGNEEETTGD
ncbi:phage tail assembly protein [Rhizobium sp. GCM10022189]|uniref:phage tail assembly protein n=1 Tax=Rhizobium sp. GCM10022189 TaxID=3252654 RepID=UPI0036191FEC